MIVYATAQIRGNEDHPRLRGTVRFRQTPNGVLICAEIFHLPQTQTGYFGFHIHEGTACTSEGAAPFESAGGHYDPQKGSHPSHAGDLPPLLSNHGYACLSVLTDRFRLCEVLGRTVVIHAQPDDFTTQSSGNSGARIACGRICLR